MKRNQIFIKSGTEYKKMTKELLAESELADMIGDRSLRIGIKPNMVSASAPSNGATTHTEIIAGILEYLTELLMYTKYVDTSRSVTIMTLFFMIPRKIKVFQKTAKVFSSKFVTV